MLEDFKRELKKLLEKYKATLWVDIEGDTHGISENFMVTVGKKEEILNHYNSSIDASDIEF